VVHDRRNPAKKRRDSQYKKAQTHCYPPFRKQKLVTSTSRDNAKMARAIFPDTSSLLQIASEQGQHRVPQPHRRVHGDSKLERK
jgi:hypothetical protein